MKPSLLHRMKPRPRKSKPSFGNQMLIASRWGLGAYVWVVMGSAKTTSLILSIPLNIFRWTLKAQEKHGDFWERSTNSMRVLGRKLPTTSSRAYVIVGDTKSIPNMRNLLGICREAIIGHIWCTKCRRVFAKKDMSIERTCRGAWEFTHSCGNGSQ